MTLTSDDTHTIHSQRLVKGLALLFTVGFANVWAQGMSEDRQFSVAISNTILITDKGNRVLTAGYANVSQPTSCYLFDVADFIASDNSFEYVRVC